MAGGPGTLELSTPLLDPHSFMGPFCHLQISLCRGGGAESVIHPCAGYDRATGLAWHPEI